MSDSRDIPAKQRIAWLLGSAGLLPLVSHALFAWLTSPYEVAGVLRSHVHYTAMLLTFLGALHWGVTIASPDVDGSAAGRRLAWGVLPALYAWTVTLLPVDSSLPMLFVGLLVAAGVDALLYRDDRVPRWFRTLRMLVTVAALASLAAGWWAMSTRMLQ